MVADASSWVNLTIDVGCEDKHNSTVANCMCGKQSRQGIKSGGDDRMADAAPKKGGRIQGYFVCEYSFSLQVRDLCLDHGCLFWKGIMIYS